MPEPFLNLQNVRKNHGNFPALQGVTFHVEKGELFGLLGPNGAGKTTLMGILAGLSPSTSGRITLEGQPFHPGDRARRHLVGLGTQDLAVYPELSAKENLVFFGKLYGMAGAELHTRADELLRAVGLQDRAHHRVGTFSGGMKRRLNLAVAVVHKPKLLLLDEPTTGVDPQSRNHIFEHVKQLNAEGMTVVYTSHYMEEVQTLCTRIAILDGGQVKACDTLTNLLALHPARVEIQSLSAMEVFAAKVKDVPGVRRVVLEPGKAIVDMDTLGPILPKVLATASACGVDIQHLIPSETNLERVFMDMTGRELRD
jgi:ABC-2 type transport system ATP-binding protein